MYVNPFWAGVVATLFVEMVLIFTIAIFFGGHDD